MGIAPLWAPNDFNIAFFYCRMEWRLIQPARHIDIGAGLNEHAHEFFIFFLYCIEQVVFYYIPAVC